MTLILLLVTARATVMTADCRLSVRGVPTTDEFQKVSFATFADARIALAYAGVAARSPAGFRTLETLLSLIAEESADDHTLHGVMGRVATRLEAAFPFDQIPEGQRLLEVVFGGYRYEPVPGAADPRLHNLTRVMGWISNTRKDEAGRPITEPAFRIRIQETHDDFGFAAGSASKSPLLSSWSDVLDAPPWHQANKAARLIKRVSESRGAGGKVGSLATSVILPRDPSEPVEFSHHADRAGRVSYLPNAVDASGERPRSIFTEARVSGGVPNGPEYDRVFGRTGKRSPCPCGSGRRYRDCHRRNESPAADGLLIVGPWVIPMVVDADSRVEANIRVLDPPYQLTSTTIRLKPGASKRP